MAGVALKGPLALGGQQWPSALRRQSLRSLNCPERVENSFRGRGDPLFFFFFLLSSLPLFNSEKLVLECSPVMPACVEHFPPTGGLVEGLPCASTIFLKNTANSTGRGCGGSAKQRCSGLAKQITQQLILIETCNLRK